MKSIGFREQWNVKTRLRHLATLQETRHGSWMEVEQPGGICCGLLSRIDQVHDLLLLVRREFWAATTARHCYSLGETRCGVDFYTKAMEANGEVLPNWRVFNKRELTAWPGTVDRGGAAMNGHGAK